MLEFDFSLHVPGFDAHYQGSIPDEGICLIFGPSGAGKSLFLRSLCALEPTAKGYIRYQQQSILTAAENLTCQPHTSPCSGLLANSQLFTHLSVAENLKLAKSQLSAPPVSELYASLSIEHLLDKKPLSLSSGESQRVLLARALLSRRELVVLDESLTNQDHARRHHILQQLKHWGEQYQFPILYSSHQADDIGEVANTLALIQTGQFEAIGPSELVSHDLALSFAQSSVAASFVLARCTQARSTDKLACFEFSGGKLLLPAGSVPFLEKQTYSIKLQARDISISLGKPAQSSILNIVDATVVDIHPLEDSAHCVVKLLIGEQLVISHITHRSVNALGLKEGMPVYAQIKAAAINKLPLHEK